MHRKLTAISGIAGIGLLGSDIYLVLRSMLFRLSCRFPSPPTPPLTSIPVSTYVDSRLHLGRLVRGAPAASVVSVIVESDAGATLGWRKSLSRH
jgi:hypothetical protein